MRDTVGTGAQDYLFETFGDGVKFLAKAFRKFATVSEDGTTITFTNPFTGYTAVIEGSGFIDGRFKQGTIDRITWTDADNEVSSVWTDLNWTMADLTRAVSEGNIARSFDPFLQFINDQEDLFVFDARGADEPLDFTGIWSDQPVFVVSSSFCEFIKASANDDTVFGKQGNDTIIGKAGDDRLAGHRGHDFLLGGQGDDSMFGGLGQDTFAFNYDRNQGNDVIHDFDVLKDTILFRGSEDTNWSVANNSDGDAVLTLASGGTVTFEGVDASAFGSDPSFFAWI